MTDDPLVDPPLEPWDRRPSETPKAYRAFTTYRDLGATRSLSEVGRQLERSASLIAKWSSVHGWVDRADAWDAYLDRHARAAAISAVREMAERHARLGALMVHRALNWLEDVPLAEMAKLRPHEVVALAAEGAKIERAALGDPAPLEPAEKQSAGRFAAEDAALEELANDPRWAALLAEVAYEVGRRTPALEDEA